MATRYEIRRRLGRGAQGDVYEVFDRHQNQVVALKFLADRTGDWREAQVLTGLRGDYILPVHNADIASGVAYIVTEVAQHGTLATITPAVGLPHPDAVKYVRHACRGAARAHDAGLVHCDIKPDNVFLDGRGNALLGDFGLAGLYDANGDGPWGGTPTTMAPEVAAGNPSSIAADVYSLGATLYMTLAGRPAHVPPDGTGQDACAWLHAIANTEPPRLIDVAPCVPPSLARCIETAMARHHQDRYASPAEFDAALGRLPHPERLWWRTDEHPGHERCWRGRKDGRVEVATCAVPDASRYRIDTHTETGRKVRRACRTEVTASQLPRAVRSAMNAVDK